MRTITIIEAKLNPAYWPLIESGEKTVEVRTEKITTSGVCVFYFQHPQTHKLLGVACINSVCELTEGWTYNMVSKLANITLDEAMELFPHEGEEPLYLYDIYPVAIVAEKHPQC